MPHTITKQTGPSLRGRLRPALVGAVRGALYRGSGVQCPSCGRQFRGFAPHRERRSAKCPGCGALERHRLLWLYLQRETPLLHDELRVLHIAPEYQLQRHLVSLRNLRYLSVDLDSPLAMEHADITALPYPEASFDVVFCNHVFEHVPDDRRAMAELERVLAPGGWGIALCPVDHSRATTYEDPTITDPAGRLAAFEQEDHVRIYGRDYPDRLRGAGFEVDVIEGYGADAPELVHRNGLARAGRIEDIYVVRKS